MDIENLDKEELRKQLKKLMGGGLGAARQYNELNELDEHDPDEVKDGYQLRFIGKDYARLQASQKTETVLVPNVAHNQKERNKNSENIFITGDNLDALKHLENSYSGRVDVIYIDPPYNTGDDGFAYNDNFSFSDEDLKLKLGLSDAEVERIRNLNGKSSHSAWLTFMYPRLRLAKRLLKDSGIIFISIDDNEQANLKVLCDEIFQESNFIGNIAWESKTKSQNTETSYNKLQPKVEHVLVYTRKSHRRFNLIKKSDKEYPLEDEQGSYREYPLEVMNATGIRGRQSMVFEIQGIMPPAGKQWQLGLDQVATYQNSGNLFIRDGRVIIKMRPGSERSETTEPFWGFLSKEIGTAESAKKELTAILGGEHGFETVKPTTLIERLLLHASDKDSLIMDFFSGSGTTGDAVMRLNVDGGRRKYILVQLDEKPDPTTQSGKTAIEAGYDTIDAISFKRLEKAADKIIEEKGNELPDNFDAGFKHYSLAATNETTLDKLNSFDPQTLLIEDMVSVFSSDSLGIEGGAVGEDTLLTTWLVDDGYKLTDTVEQLRFAGAKAYIIEGRLYILDTNWNSASTKALLNELGNNRLHLNSVVLYTYSFGLETLRELKVNLKTNLEDTIEIIERF